MFQKMMRLFLCSMIILGMRLTAVTPVSAEELSVTSEKVAVVNFVPAQVIAPTASANSPQTITVGPLVAQRGDQAWLNKAISDLLIKYLSLVPSLVVLEREKMQAFSKEVGLSDSALFNQEKALRVGRVAKVEKVLFGNYLLNGEKITISLSLLELETQKIMYSEEITGDYNDLHQLIQDLVFKFLNHQHVDIPEMEKKNIKVKVTDSITATEHFYRGIDQYDQGRYPEAFTEFLTAARQDKKYVEAYLWTGKMLEEQNFYDLAVLSYQQLYDQYPQTIEARDALLFAAQIYAYHLENSDKAIEVYTKLTEIKPVNPHALEASFHLGEWLSAQGEYLRAYLEFKKIDDFRQWLIQDPSLLLRSTQRGSRFVTWSEVLSLYKESLVKMIPLYQKLVYALDKEKLPPQPRGVIVLDPNNPFFREQAFGHTEPLFPNEQISEHWNEKLYAVIIPKGYLAAGIDMSITGQLKISDASHDYTFRVLPFPLPRDFDRRWLGAIFGQTDQKTTLKKSVSFNGQHLDILTLQILENHSQIFDWNIHVKIVAQENLKDQEAKIKVETSQDFWEGKPLAQIPFSTRPWAGSTRLLQQEWYKPRKEMDILYDPSKGYFLVTALGESDGEQTDLWMTQSSDETHWSELKRMDLNSLSEDSNPRLMRGEDGAVVLTWISNREGKGWEIWLSILGEDGRWINPRRIPLEKLIDSGMMKRLDLMNTDVLEYDIFQDNHGRWIIAYYSYATNAIVLIQSADFERWEVLSTISSHHPSFGLSLIQDSSAVYRLGYIGYQGKIHLWSSNDAITWTERSFDIHFWNQSFMTTPAIHRLKLFPLELGNILMLVSDNQYGLQFARFHADTREPLLDLVTRSELQAYAATKILSGQYVVALKEEDGIVLRQYQNFNVSGKEIKKDTRGWPIYQETERDDAGHEWTRIFAQARRRVSDVTSLGLEPQGRVWWGIESGIMYKDGEQFFATNVSQGFFNHFITDIVSCSNDRVWFASKFLNQPQLGLVNYLSIGAVTVKTGAPPRFQTVNVPGIQENVSAVTCVDGADEIWVGTSHGKIIQFDGKEVKFHEEIKEAPYITALAFNKSKDEWWVGTEDQGMILMKQSEQKYFNTSNGLASNHVLDVVIDQKGDVWAALYGQGLMRYVDDHWIQSTPANSGLLYWSVDHLRADSKGGIWYLPYDDVPSKGLGYFDGKTAQAFNPPHDSLHAPSSLVVEPNGVIWVGTWFDGVYKLQRQEVK